MKNKKNVNDKNPAYPKTPITEDIYNQDGAKADIDIDAIAEYQVIEDKDKREEDRLASELGQDLDVPGSELDDAQESIGSEDEENNYYSIGGDRHNALDENNGK